MASITQHRFHEHVPLAGYIVRMQRDDLPVEVNSALAMAAAAITELGARVDKLEKCPECSGTGQDHPASVRYRNTDDDRCPRCNGTGKTR